MLTGNVGLAACLCTFFSLHRSHSGRYSCVEQTLRSYCYSFTREVEFRERITFGLQLAELFMCLKDKSRCNV